MSAPFEPGDVVVCVGTNMKCPPNAHYTGVNALAKGRHYRVTSIWLGVSGVYGVRLAGFPHATEASGCPAPLFRKINDEQYPEVLEAILSCKKPERPALNPSRHYADGRGVQLAKLVRAA
jgi:hypothetical protein